MIFFSFIFFSASQNILSHPIVIEYIKAYDIVSSFVGSLVKSIPKTNETVSIDILKDTLDKLNSINMFEFNEESTVTPQIIKMTSFIDNALNEIKVVFGRVVDGLVLTKYELVERDTRIQQLKQQSRPSTSVNGRVKSSSGSIANNETAVAGAEKTSRQSSMSKQSQAFVEDATTSKRNEQLDAKESDLAKKEKSLKTAEANLNQREKSFEEKLKSLRSMEESLNKQKETLMAERSQLEQQIQKVNSTTTATQQVQETKAPTSDETNKKNDQQVDSKLVDEMKSKLNKATENYSELEREHDLLLKEIRFDLNVFFLIISSAFILFSFFLLLLALTRTK